MPRYAFVVTLVVIGVVFYKTAEMLSVYKILIDSKEDAPDEVSVHYDPCLLYTSPSPRDQRGSRMPSSA